jgi:paraquat-inducible protein B
MQAKNYYLSIGIFVIGALAIIVAGIVALGGGGVMTEKHKYVMFFERSIQGLQVGAPVKIKGAKVGEVTDINIEIDGETLEFLNVVYAELDPGEISWLRQKRRNPIFDRLVAKGMRAQLQVQSMLTGMLFVQIDFHQDAPLKYYKLDPDTKEIPVIPTEMDLLLDAFSDIDFAKLAANIERILHNIENFTGNPELHALPGNANATVLSIKKLADDVDGQLVKEMTTAVKQLNLLLSELGKDVPGLTDSAQEILTRLEKSMGNISHILSDDSPMLHEITGAVQELNRTLTAVRSLANTIDQQPESLLKGKKEPKEQRSDK